MDTAECCRHPPAAAADGPYLPLELIPCIAKHLTSLQDLRSLRAACRRYRAFLPRPPHLLVPQILVPDSSPSLAAFHLPLRRLLRLGAPVPFPDNLVTSDGARIVTVDDANCEFVVSHLLSGQQVRMPSARYPYSHVVLTGDLLLLHSLEGIQYCRLGDRTWRRASSSEHQYTMHDMRYANGVLYGISRTCRLAVAEPRDNKSFKLTLLGGEADEEIQDAWAGCKSFMLGECAGDLLLIFRRSGWMSYKVFRWESLEKKWVRARSLGGRTIFMSCTHVNGWFGPDSPGIRRDCIYQTTPGGGWSQYSLVDRTCEDVSVEYHGAPEVGQWRQQVWLHPSLF